MTSNGISGSSAPLKVAFLIGSDNASTRLCIESVCRLHGVTAVAVLLDVYHPPAKARWKNLRRNVSREGPGYIGRRLLRALRTWLDSRASAMAPSAEVQALLRAAFPEKSFSVDELARRYEFPVYRIANLNHPDAAQCLRECGATLGIVIGTRVLKRSTFSIPEWGCINIHKGKVPEFRGMPPGFWELYENAPSAGITVHFVDDGLDTGDIVGCSEIPIHAKETVTSLQTKLNHEGARVLAQSVADLRSGCAQRRPQPASVGKPRSKPLRVQELELASRAPHLQIREGDLKATLKTLFYLGFWHLGIQAALRFLRRPRKGRGVILLYHRITDLADDALTASPRIFAEHLITLRRYYHVVETSRMVDKIREGGVIDSHTVAIHFDDCYRDVYREAAPLIQAAGVSATMFIATGFIDTDRIFEHDKAKYPVRLENLHRSDIPALLTHGFQVGAHTVNHVDLGEISPDEAWKEILESKQCLEEITDEEIRMFSFPFGKERNIRQEVRDLVQKAGFSVLFSAHGGSVSGGSDPYDVPRIGVNGHFRPLDLLMLLEGLTLPQLFSRIRRE